jgi:hypothetical protein
MPYKSPAKRRAYFARRNKEPARIAQRKAGAARWKREKPDRASFVAVDLEGFSYGEPEAAKDRLFQPHKAFLAGAGDKEGAVDWLYTGKALTTLELCDWLTGLSKLFGLSIFVSFSFGYDVAQILADLPYEKAWEVQHGRAFDSPDDRKNNRRIVLWGEYGFQYLKGKKFCVYRFAPGASPYVENPRTGARRVNAIAKILLFDVFGFFQASFLKACKSMPGAVTPDEYDLLFSGKGNRANFQISDVETVKPYTAAELRVLARMMDKLRASMISENIHVRQWFGAGSIAQALLKRENVVRHFWPLESENLSAPQLWAHHAYFGGRIELVKQGATDKTLYGYDVASAYPYIATLLPSMRFGQWKRRVNPTRRQIEKASLLSIVHVKTHGFPKAPFYPLPYRTPKGSILFPQSVNGYYMQAEVVAAFKWADHFEIDDEKIECVAMWEFIVGSTEKPFTFLQELFDYRTRLSKEDITQIVVKLGINACYGKLSQAVSSGTGKPPAYANPWYAAAITAGTRAKLLEACLTDPEAIVMLATDGIISTRKLPIKVPSIKTLGAWEAGTLKDGGVFIQSGVYAISDEKGLFFGKSRGFRPTNLKPGETVVDLLKGEILEAWRKDLPEYSFDYSSYMTLGASVASRDLYQQIGRWVRGVRTLDLRGCGVKRNVSVSAGPRRERARKLIATSPNCSNFVLCDAKGELALSAVFTPEWISEEIGAEKEQEQEVEAIFAARFGD